ALSFVQMSPLLVGHGALVPPTTGGGYASSNTAVTSTGVRSRSSLRNLRACRTTHGILSPVTINAQPPRNDRHGASKTSRPEPGGSPVYPTCRGTIASTIEPKTLVTSHKPPSVDVYPAVLGKRSSSIREAR